MVEKGCQSQSSNEETKFLPYPCADPPLKYKITVDVDAPGPIICFSKLATDQLKWNLISFLNKYDKSRPLETCVKSCGTGMEFSSYLNELWNASSQAYAIPQQYLWANSFIESILFFANNGDPVAASSDYSSVTQDEVGLFEMFDMHKLRNCNMKTEDDEEKELVVQTADEVIEEIEGILQFSDEQIEICEEHDVALTFNNGESEDFEEFISNTPFHFYQDAMLLDKTDNERSKSLKRMTVTEIVEELKNMEASVKLLSETLLVELNKRDELNFEKEIRNTFITRILEVQYKQEQLTQGAKNVATDRTRSRFGKLTKSFSMNNTSDMTAGRFLTTAIPYDNYTAPSLENLQVLIQLLDAIKQDSSDVPALIADYILNVLCPAPLPDTFLKF